MDWSNWRNDSCVDVVGARPNLAPMEVVDGGHALAQAIVDTIREPLLVLDEDLRVVTANRSFYMTFRMQRQDVQGLPVYALGMANGISRSFDRCCPTSRRSMP
jgi:PAS domain-containing protein